MPLVEITSGKTGEKFTLDFQSDPTQEDVDEAVAQVESSVSPSAPVVPSGTMAPSGRTPEQEALAQQFIRSEQRPALNKVMEGALGLGEALVKPVVSLAKGAMQIPTVAAAPETLLPTGAEASRRLGMDILNIARMGAKQLPAILSQGPTGFMVEQLAGLAPRTPSEAEVDQFVEQAPLEQAIAEERQKVAFEGANPEFAEALTQIVELAPPVKGVRALASPSLAKAPVSRILRAATKPAKQFGSRFEKAADNTISDIYHAFPEADKMTAMPFEGFHDAVASVKKQVGLQIDEGLKQSGTPIAAGDRMAAALNKRADELAKAGQPAETVNFLANRAQALVGQVTDMESLREATTLANRANSPLFQRTREAANPLRAQAETMANEIIARIGGEVENSALASVKGPQGAKLRKKWSDLTLIESQTMDRLNKIINQAPPEIQSAVVGTLTSPEGLGGLFALSQGYLVGGTAALVSGAVKSWAKNATKALRDSNSLVTSAYDKLRANPPKAPTAPVAVRPPPLPVTALSIPPPLPSANPLQQAISQAAFPSRPAQAPTVLPRTPQLSLQQLNQEFLAAVNRGDSATAERLLSQIMGPPE